jgi:hypothetical protein
VSCPKKRHRLGARDVLIKSIFLRRNFDIGVPLTLRTRIVSSGKECNMGSIIYLVGLIVVVMFILGALGLR